MTKDEQALVDAVAKAIWHSAEGWDDGVGVVRRTRRFSRVRCWLGGRCVVEWQLLLARPYPLDASPVSTAKGSLGTDDRGAGSRAGVQLLRLRRPHRLPNPREY